MTHSEDVIQLFGVFFRVVSIDLDVLFVEHSVQLASFHERQQESGLKRPNSRQTRNIKQAQNYIQKNLQPKELHYNQGSPNNKKKSQISSYMQSGV